MALEKTSSVCILSTRPQHASIPGEPVRRICCAQWEVLNDPYFQGIEIT